MEQASGPTSPSVRETLAGAAAGTLALPAVPVWTTIQSRIPPEGSTLMSFAEKTVPSCKPSSMPMTCNEEALDYVATHGYLTALPSARAGAGAGVNRRPVRRTAALPQR